MNSPHASGTHNGFTLVELAVVLFIVALLMGGLLVPLSAQVDQKNYSETRKLLSEVREALLGYAMTHSATDGKPRLPCPDTDNNGTENINLAGTACTSQEGSLPWSDLGVGASDAWNNRIHYRVEAQFSNPSTGFSLASTGAIRVCNTISPCVSLATALPVVFISHGPNGWGAVNTSGNINPAPSGSEELANTDGDNDFAMAEQGQNGFDDLVVWLPANTLFNRMVSAGKLP